MKKQIIIGTALIITSAMSGLIHIELGSGFLSGLSVGIPVLTYIFLDRYLLPKP